MLDVFTSLDMAREHLELIMRTMYHFLGYAASDRPAWFRLGENMLWEMMTAFGPIHGLTRKLMAKLQMCVQKRSKLSRRCTYLAIVVEHTRFSHSFVRHWKIPNNCHHNERYSLSYTP